jgi:hypothetical protein
MFLLSNKVLKCAKQEVKNWQILFGKINSTTLRENQKKDITLTKKGIPRVYFRRYHIIQTSTKTKKIWKGSTELITGLKFTLDLLASRLISTNHFWRIGKNQIKKLIRSLVYDHGNYPAVNKSQSQDKLKNAIAGTRFSKSKSHQEPWRPNNPAKKGYNKTFNKERYYHTGLYYEEKEEKKIHDEKIWMYVRVSFLS